MKTQPFTLLELVVVMAIIAVTTTLAVSALRGESPLQQVNSAALRFETFCARVRYQAIENGSDRLVVFDPDLKQFSMALPEGEEEETGTGVVASQAFVWKLPENFELENDMNTLHNSAGDDGKVEIFRFFSDGSADASREFILRYRSFQRRFEISPLTGGLNLIEESTP